MYTWVTSDRSAAWNWAPRVGRIIWVTALRFFLVGSSSSLSSTLPPASFPPALYHRNNWTIVQVCGVKKKCASNTTCTGKVFSHRPVTLTWLANRALRSFYKIPYPSNAKFGECLLCSPRFWYQVTYILHFLDLGYCHTIVPRLVIAELLHTGKPQSEASFKSVTVYDFRCLDLLNINLVDDYRQLGVECSYLYWL